MVSVIASSVRKGNVIEKDGKLYVVLTAENYPSRQRHARHPSEMRRISDGVKIVDRYKTTDSVEKAFVEHQTYNYLYQDGEHYVFMEPADLSTSCMSARMWSATGRPICRKHGSAVAAVQRQRRLHRVPQRATL